MSRFSGIVFGSLLISSLAFAQNGRSTQTHYDKKYFEVASVSLTENAPELWQSTIGELTAAELPSLSEGVPDLAPWNVLLDQVINMGKKIWDIVIANRPVVDLKNDVASAVPQGISGWQALGEWQTPHSKVFTLRYKNFYGMEVVHFEYRLSYTPGGSYNGVGRYLANVSIVPSDVTVAWGYKFAALSTIANTLNVGTQTAPVGGMELNVGWSIDTPIKHIQSSGSYFVQGDGKFLDLTNGNSLL
jgi:hypothetical protein